MTQAAQREKVVAVRAVRQEMSGESKLFFLFTAGQVEEVLSEITLLPVPFAPSFLAGMSLWRGQLLPVIDLEECFSFSADGSPGKVRFIVVRTGTPESAAGEKVFRCVLRISEDIHSINAPDGAVAVSSEHVGVQSSLVRGTYQLHDENYIVPDLFSILENRQSVKNEPR